MVYIVQKASQKLAVARATSGTRFNAAGDLIVVPASQIRFDYDLESHEFRGALSEPAATNLLLNSALLASQARTVTNALHQLSFYGTGSITLSGAHSAVLAGTGANQRAVLGFTPSAGTLNLAVSGNVRMAQLELGSRATSFIPTLGATVTRAADGMSFALPPGTFNAQLTLDDNTVAAINGVSGTLTIPTNLARRHIRRIALRPV